LFSFLFFLGMYRSDYYFSKARTTPNMVNRKAPTFSLPEAFGGQVDLGTYRGRPVLLVFWTMSDAECRRELSMISQVAPELRSKGIGVVAIHVGDVGNLKEYLKSNQIALTALVDTDGEVSMWYHVEGQHKLVLVGSDGVIKESSDPQVDEKMLRKWIGEVSGA
jgi:peroxiredoxin